MGLRFIFMLTRNDRTVADASQQLQTALSLGVRHMGFKDIGLPIEQLKGLNAAIKAGGASSYLEVVSLDRESEIVSAKAAVDIGVDVLLGGTRVDDVLPIIKGTGIQYFRVAKFEGASPWSFRQHDDELFFVHRGRLLMRFRDREEIVEPGEFIVVPHGVEHCAVALDGEASEVLLATTAA
jgi:quercetin dioxygenase-like cupin family protein